MRVPGGVFLRAGLVAIAVAACRGDGVGPDGTDPILTPTPFDLVAEGQGAVPERFTAELWVSGNTAYTTTWSTRVTNGAQARGNAIKIWDVSAATPVLVDSLIVSGVTTIGDVQVTADGHYLVAGTEPTGSMLIYDLQDPRKPVLVSRLTSAEITNGVHTAEVQRVNGRLYAFLCIDPRGASRARLLIVDITNPGSPVVVFSRSIGAPFVHDVFVRDGIMMTALWDDGIAIFDIGGGGRGGTIENPVQLGASPIVGGKAHNIFWYNDPVTGSKRFALVGEEGPGSIGFSSVGDVHVMDVSDLTNPHEVSFYNVPGAGVHNFSADEERGILYAAYYNGGVRALSIRGEIGACTVSQKGPDGRCDLRKMKRELAKGPAGIASPVYVWGVQFTDGRLYASDMLNGLWRLSTVPVF
ncbi:MAG: hypothetical protein ABI681_02900 [Gemmatimonadales bacterium]